MVSVTCIAGTAAPVRAVASIAREMSDAGRSNVRLCGRPSTAGYVRELSGTIAEIVGQFEAQRLLAPAYHQELLDRFAGSDALRARESVDRAQTGLLDLVRKLDRLHGDENQARERHANASFALREIEDARPEPGEEQRLDERRHYLDNRQRIAESLGRAREALAGDESGAIATLGNASSALGSIANIGAGLRAMAEQAVALQSQANDLAASVGGELDSGDLDPGELDAINARLELLDRLKRKYGGSIESVLAHAETAREAVDDYESRDRATSDLSANVAGAERDLQAAAQTLTALRKRSASALVKRIRSEFADLALGSARFDVALEPLERIGPDGAERIEFLFAANAGESLRPLARIASGGELSRMLLALIVTLSEARDADAALVFDEIDTGIGGTTGTAVGARIGRLARAGQVVCVTHLAQLATWADRHYLLEKSERAKVTTIAVREIAGAGAREAELARMLSGETHDVAIKHARELLRKAKSS